MQLHERSLNMSGDRDPIFGFSTKQIRQIPSEGMKLHRTNKFRRRRSDFHREEEVYTDKDRAAAVNMGSRDIKQSLKMKRKHERNKMMQIPDEAEPGSMLALGMKELRCANLCVALSCMNKVNIYIEFHT
ncbi:hypothetical protein QAD02_017281 [Eretmocerus hayati]|uniref:Uncharacterized protein n=1 Tax=Eretmocerus hayati TaxID=131215 RepID=A0ACC2PDV2_9HYME|nr:hypothetical protein QAD02_017281 [Eretmocerus hayati]